MQFVIWIALLVGSIVIHELSHGGVAYLLGDDTAKRAGRLSINPLRHLDPFWTVLFPILLFVVSHGRFVFAMAKPVPVDFRRLHQPKQDMAWVGAAGPGANFLLAVLFSLLWKLFQNEFLLFGAYLNLGLGIFNMVPIPPLDGSRVLASFLPGKMAVRYLNWERVGYLLLFALYFTGFLIPFLLPIVDFFCRLLDIPLLSGVA